MADLGTLVPNNDNAVGSYNKQPGAGTLDIWTAIDEGIASADDSDYIQPAAGGGTNVDYKAEIQNTPSDFSVILTLNYNIRYKQFNRVDDTIGLQIRIMGADGTTVLAAADSGGTFQSVDSNVTTTTFINKGSTAFSYVNTGASKSTWDGMVLVIRQTYSATKGNDNGRINVSAVELTGTYTPVAAAIPNDVYTIRQAVNRSNVY